MLSEVAKVWTDHVQADRRGIKSTNVLGLEMGLMRCELCGMTYVEGDPEDEQRHDEERHDGFIEALKPAPSSELRVEYQSNPEIVWVDLKSPEWLRTSVYWRAKIFKREFGYDMPQWEIKGYHDPKAIGYIFRDNDFRIIGACCFRPHEKQSKQMLLDWIWICPSERRKGVVSQHWEEFRQRFGTFLVGGPVSEAMLEFLRHRFPDHKITGDDDVQQPQVPMERFVNAAT
jgi:hypothetical protein